MQGWACRWPIQDPSICASPAPAQGHRREDALLAEVGSYLPRRCPPPVRLYSRLTGLHNRQTAPRWQVRASDSACSLPRARTEETWGPQASQWRTNTTQPKTMSPNCSSIQAAHPPATHPSSDYCLRPLVCDCSNTLHPSGASSSQKGKHRSPGLQTRLPRHGQENSSRPAGKVLTTGRTAGYTNVVASTLAPWLLPTTLNQQNTP